MKTKNHKKMAVPVKVLNSFINDSLGLKSSNEQMDSEIAKVITLPDGFFIKEALDFRLDDPEVTEITLWKLQYAKAPWS